MDDYKYHKLIHPLSFIGKMSLPEFNTWLDTDKYGNYEKCTEEDLLYILGMVQDYRELDKYQDHILNRLIRGNERGNTIKSSRFKPAGVI